MNPDAEYRLRVLDPQGTEKYVLELDPQAGGLPLYLHGGPKSLEVGPLGDCREATFEGDPTTLGIGPRDTVQVQYRPNPASPWRSRYGGTAVVSGSSRSELGRYKLQGLRYRRLTEVECRTLLRESDLGVQVRQLFRDLIATGQLGTTLQLPTPETIPDLGVTSAALAPNWWTPAQLLDERLKGRHKRTATYSNADGSVTSRDVNPDWGVDAELRPVFGYPSGVLEIDEATPGVEIDGMDLDSTVLVTDVRPMFGRTMNAARGEAITYVGGDIRGGLVSLDDLKAQRPITHEVPVAPHTWGVGWRRLPLGTAAPLFAPLVPSEVVVGVASALFIDPPPPEDGSPPPPVNHDPTVTGEPANLWDNRSETTVSIEAPSSARDITYSLVFTYPDETPVPDGVLLAVVNASAELFVVSGQGEGEPASRLGVLARFTAPNSPVAPLYLLPGATRDERLLGRWASGKSLTLWLRHTDLNKPVVISAGCLARADQALLQGAAAPLARTPTLNPVTARIPGWDVEPAGTARLTLRDVTGQAVETRELPIDLLVYSVDDDGGLWTEVRCGQTDDAEALSFGGTLALGNQGATLTAVEATT